MSNIFEDVFGHNSYASKNRKSSTRLREQSDFLQIHEIASALRCSARHVRRLTAKGEFPKPLKIGRLRRWHRSAFEAWLKQNTPNI